MSSNPFRPCGLDGCRQVQTRNDTWIVAVAFDAAANRSYEAKIPVCETHWQACQFARAANRVPAVEG